MKNALIIGGSSGLGLELAKKITKEYKVIATGRRLPKVDGIVFRSLELSVNNKETIDAFIRELPKIDLLCIAAGFFQVGTLTDLTDEDIDKMFKVGLETPTLIIKKILEKQKEIPIFIPITSTSQWTPRLKEPIYTAIKGGFGMLANSLSLDPMIGKTLLVGPAGMKTRFWENSNMDTSTFLEPGWVAGQILRELSGEYRYKFVKIMREPSRAEVSEIRD